MTTGLVRCVWKDDNGKECGTISKVELDQCPKCGHDEGVDVLESELVKQDVEPENTDVAISVEELQTARAAILGGGNIDEVKSALIEEDLKRSSLCHTERDLDEAVNKVIELKSEFCVSDWRLGKAIAEIASKQLWKLRVVTDSDGKQKAKYASYASFCNTELKITPEHARRYMDVGNNYTEEQVRQWGMGKLTIVLQAAPEKRPELIAKLEESNGKLPKRELEKIVKETRAAGGGREVPKRLQAAHAARDAKNAEKAEEKKKKQPGITIASILGKQLVPLYQKPAKLPTKPEGWKDLVRAKKLGEEGCIARVELANDVSMIIVVQEDTRGQLQLRITTAREEPGEE